MSIITPPQLGEIPGPRLELLGKIGNSESKDEKDLLFDPADAARLPNGDILILERRGCTVKRFNKDRKFVSCFGQKGQGPGDFQSPFLLRLNTSGDRLYVADYRISVFSIDGGFEESFKPERTAGYIEDQHRTSGMAILSGSRVLLPSRPSLWQDTGEHKLLSVYDKTGTMIASFGAVRKYDNPKLTLNANVANFANDDGDNVFVAYAFQNRIDKYSQDGNLIFSADRPLPYEIRNEMRPLLFRSGSMEQEVPWPSVTSVTKGIYLDYKDRIWVLTFLKPPNKFGTFNDEENITQCLEFHVFNPNGILLSKVPFPNIRIDNFSIYGDRVYLIDSEHEACVYEYRIVE